MKKVLCLLFVVCLLLGSVANADNMVLNEDGSITMRLNKMSVDEIKDVISRLIVRLTDQQIDISDIVPSQYQSGGIGDISSLSLAELAALKNRIQYAMLQTNEWQAVTVPVGVYRVGAEIPAGTWTVKCENKVGKTIIQWGESLKDNGENIAYNGRYSTFNAVYNPNDYWYQAGAMTEYTFTVYNGDYIIIDNGAALFTPYAGKPDLGFK